MKAIAILIAVASVSPSTYAGPDTAGESRQDAQPPARKAAAVSKGNPKKSELTFTAEREAAALAFVETNHRELLAVLKPLAQMARPQYEKAIVELFRTSETLADVKDRDPARYELLNTAWQLKSRVDLAAATLAKAPDDKLRGELRELLRKQLENQSSMLKLERSRVKERLAKLEADIARIDSGAADEVERRYKRLAKIRPANKRAVKKKTDAGEPK